MKWSQYQLALFEHNLSSTRNAFVNAVAGSGKTTAIVECIENVSSDQQVLAVAFGREIKKTLIGKLSHLSHVTVKTLNGFGYGACRAAVKRYINIKEEKVQDTLFYDVIGGRAASEDQKKLYYKSRYLISKIIGIWKADMTWWPEIKDMVAVMDRFALNLPKDTSEAQIFDLLLTTFMKSMAKTMVMDFDDQIAMPLYHNWQLDSYDRVFVDEAQDLTPAQIELTRRACRGPEMESPNGGRATYVGDRRQAIYQFRGADSNAVSNIISLMKCEELPLSICYRCSKSVVRLAQRIVPHIEYHEDSPEGEEGVISQSDFMERVAEGDLILCRTTAPLVKLCLEFIRKEIKATVKGREIGESLIELIEAVPHGVALADFQQNLMEYVHKRLDKLKFRPDAAIVLQDQFETIQCLYERADCVDDLAILIRKIFSDNATGIMLMTIHKAKGLEEKNVFIISPELIPHKMATTEEAQLAEENLAYVAITRAKMNLYRVGCELKLLENRDAAH